MKFLLFLAVVLAGVWLWRSGRAADAPPKRQAQEPPRPQDMVSCAWCGVHIPQSDAVAGRSGVYCCADHHQRAEP